MMKRMLTVFVAAILASVQCDYAIAQTYLNGPGEDNFSGRRAIIINNASPYLRLSMFSFYNKLGEPSMRMQSSLKWTNIGKKSITAFEIVELFFDPFNRPIAAGGRWLVPGHDSANWSPLRPGQSGTDGLIDYQEEMAFTGIVYVRAIRFNDGSVWYSDQSQVAQDVKTAMPALRELPPLDPGPGKRTH